MQNYEEMKVELPEGTSGPWTVKKFTVSEAQAKHNAMMAAIRGSRRSVPAGDYTAIYRENTLVMSDTPDEMRDHMRAIFNAKDHCLVFGLGIGMVVKAMLEKPEVTKVTVVELSPDVIALTGPTLKAKYGDRVEIINANALEWKPPKGSRFGAVWADIWDDICADNIAEMSKFNRRYSRMSDWHGNWAEGLCRDQNRRGRNGWF